MSEPAIVICFKQPDGKIIPDDSSYELSDFAGVVPAVGDKILAPGVQSGLDRRQPENRRIWTVLERIFHARDVPDCIALVVEERKPDTREFALLG